MFLSFGLPQGNHCHPGRVSSQFLVDYLRDTDGVGFGQPLQPRGDIHPIAKYIAILLDDVAQMDADADMNLFGFLFLRIVGPELGLNLCAHWTAFTTEGKSTKKASPTVLMTMP